MDNKRTDGSQSGRSMVEMLGVLAIIGVLSIGGIAGYSRAMIKFKVGKSLDQISMLVASIQTLYSGQRNYSGLTLKEAISYGVISPDMKASDSTVTNVFAGSVLLGEAKYRETAGAAFQIVYNGLGQEACVTMASSDWGTGSSAGLIGMRVSDQELALAAAPALAGQNAAVFSVGSDGTDGPTDAAGGYVDGDTLSALTAKGWNVFDTLQNNDAYHALKAVDGLILTGATGTNVNDAAVALVGEK